MEEIEKKKLRKIYNFRGVELMELIGRVLWWSERDENGIIVDPKGNEFYFDRSVLKLSKKQQIKRNSLVTFRYNKKINNCLCACNVSLPALKSKKHIESEYQRLLSDNAV